jgi:succinyl-CoA synthetase beta subunit
MLLKPSSCRWTWKGGGVKLAKNLQQIAGQIIGMQLITPQTSAEGKKSAQY